MKARRILWLYCVFACLGLAVWLLTIVGTSGPLHEHINSASVKLKNQTIQAEGIARMRPLAQVVLPPGRIVKIEPGAVHMMLVELKHALESGTQVPLTLQFRDAGKIDMVLNIEHRDVAGLENEMTRGIGTVTVVARRTSTLPTSNSVLRMDHRKAGLRKNSR